MRRVLVTASLVLPCLFPAVSCAGGNPVGPTSSATLDQFLQALRQQGLGVNLGSQISPNANGFFSAPLTGTSERRAGERVRLYERAGRGHRGRFDLRGRPTESDDARHLGEYAAFLP